MKKKCPSSSAGEVIKLLRKSAGRTQTDFARVLGYARAYLSEVETGRRSPGLCLIQSVSQELKVPVAIFFCFDCDKDSDESQILYGLFACHLRKQYEKRRVFKVRR